MCNQDVRTEIKQAGLKYWQIAHAIGINDDNFSRKLRVELPNEEKQRIRQTIKEIKESEESNHATNANSQTSDNGNTAE